MDKLQMDTWPDLICGHVVIEVGADTPEVLIRIDNLHPATTRCLQQRMDQKEEEPAPRRQYTGDLLDGRFKRLDVLDRQAEQNRVEPGIPKGKLVGTGLQVPRKASSIVCPANLRPTGIEGDHLRPLTGEASADLPFTATDVQYPRAPRA